MPRWRLLSLISLASLAHALKGPTPEEQKPVAYIMKDYCDRGEGLGTSMRHVIPVIDVAQKLNLKFVCHDFPFESGGHALGDMGFLFGCFDDKFIIGDMASYESIKDKKVVETRLRDIGSDNVTIDISGPLEKDVVYMLRDTLGKGCTYTGNWGTSWKWFRSQYQLMRHLDPARKQPACHSKRRTNVVVHIRRGDGPDRQMPTKVYEAALDRLFSGNVTGLKHLREKNANLVIMAETPEDDAEMQVFKKYTSATVTLYLGQQIMGWDPMFDARSRVLRDLDCMSTADVLLLSKGQFSALGSIIQKDGGISLVLDPSPSSFSRNTNPNAKHLFKMTKSTKAIPLPRAGACEDAHVVGFGYERPGRELPSVLELPVLLDHTGCST